MYYFQEGGDVTVPMDPDVGEVAGVSGALAEFAGDYVTDMLGRGEALSQQPYQAYTGPLTAGTSGLQDTAFTGLANLALPTTAANFDATTAQNLMNPFIQSALNPQLQAARDEAERQRLANAARLQQAGAFGGSRQAIMESEGQRNLNQNLADIRAKGYAQAYDQAMDQFGRDRAYGLDALTAQRAGGAEQRAIEGEGVAADFAQFREERDFPYKQVQYAQSLLQGLPIAARAYSYNQPSTLSTVLGSAGGISGLLENLFNIGGGEDKSYVDDMINDAIAAGGGDT